MIVQAKTLLSQSMNIETSEAETISDLKRKIAMKARSNNDNMMLMYASKKLDDNRTLKDYKIQNGSMVFIFLNMHNWDRLVQERKLH